MFNCHSFIGGYHNKEVRLSQDVQQKMHERSKFIRDYIRGTLPKSKQIEFVVQGSFAMSTMVADYKGDFDIDYGAYLLKDQLVNPKGAELSPENSREFVCELLKNGNLGLQFEVTEKCVRVNYDGEYHVDLPVYRVVQKYGNHNYEIALGDEWKLSNTRKVTGWFLTKRRESGDLKQILRIVRLLKKFAKSHENWKNKTLSGFGISVLVVKCYKLNSNRIDVALFETMKEIHLCLNKCLVIEHPTMKNSFIVDKENESETKFFNVCIESALTKLKKLQKPTCNKAEALEIWNSVFATKYFTKFAQ